MIVLVALYQVKPGHGDVVAEALTRVSQMVAETEPGCPLFQICRSQEDPNHFLLYEHYIDEAALQKHREMPAYLEIVQKEIAPLLDKRERTLYNLIAG
jgi:quinol monooxygenase YgiN